VQRVRFRRITAEIARLMAERLRRGRRPAREASHFWIPPLTVPGIGSTITSTGHTLARSLGQPSTEEEEGFAMFFELRQYPIRPGQRDNWVKCMEEEIIPFQVKMGMVVEGSFVGEQDESVYVWIRRFTDEEERKRLYDAVYQSDYWKTEIAPRVGTMIDREGIKVTRLVATPISAIQ
jgi:hypothetical protein